MLLNELKSPIQIINAEDIKEKPDSFLSDLQKPFKNLSPDLYLVRQKEIEFLKQNIKKPLDAYNNKFWFDYYTGRISKNERQEVINLLPAHLQAELNSIKPTRFRAVSEFNLHAKNQTDAWNIERVKVAPFSQGEALTTSGDIDYRQASRTFDELPQKHVGTSLEKLISHSASHVKRNHPNIKELGLVIHHTNIKAEFNNNELNLATNSPEGVHQDGMDYIVSAFVVERNNISGGLSTVFGADKSTPIFETTLHTGMGLFQPDKGTDLWHVVSPIHALDKSGGNRATIGFDFIIR